MNNSLIQKVVNRSNLTVLAASMIGMFVLVGLVVFNLRYIYNFAAGPFEVVPNDILKAGSASAPFRYWVHVSGSDMVNTGMQYIEKSDGGKETIESTYFVMPVEHQLLLVRVPGDQQAETLPANITGWLSEISSQENQKVVQDIITQEPALKNAFLSYKLDTGSFRSAGIIGIIFGVVILVASLWGLVTFFLRMADPNAHPILEKLKRFGPLEFVTNRIETELASPHTTIGKLHLTNEWMVYEARTNLSATRYEDVVWVYKFVFTQKSYGITVNKVYTAKVYDRYGVLCDFVAGRKEEQVNQMLEAICQRTPWAIMGFSKEVETAFRKDRQGFLAAVEQRRSALAA